MFCRKKWYLIRPISQPGTEVLFAGLLMLNVKACYYILEYLNANLLSIHLFAFDIDWT